MVNHLKIIFTIIILIFIIGFSAFISFHQEQTHMNASNRLKDHALVIANSLWQFEKEGPIAYLRLAAQSNNYKNIIVTDDSGEMFTSIKITRIDKSEMLLTSAGFLPVYRLEQAILFNNEAIGKIAVDWENRAVFTYFYILICMVLLLAGIWFFLNLLVAKKTLETRVIDRTADLKESQERLQAILDNADAIIYLKDIHGRYITVNEQFVDLFNVDQSSIIGMNDDNIFPTEIAKELQANDQQILKEKIPLQFEESAPDHNGIFRDYLSVKFPLKKANGEIYAVCGISTDITDRKLAEQKLKISEDKFRTLYDSAQDAITLFSPEKGFVDCNEAALKLFAIPSKAQLTELSVADISSAQQPGGALAADLIGKVVNRALDEGFYLFEWQHMDLNKREFPATVLATRMELEGEIVLQCVIRDISERKQAEEELHHLRNYLSNIIDSMPSVLIGVDLEGNITQWNKHAEQVTGFISKDAMGQPLEKVYPHLSNEMSSVHDALSTRKEQQNKKQAHLQGNELRYEDVTVYPLIANGIEGAVIRIDDVTDQVHLEEMVVQSEKMLSVGGLAAGMAHEINNPLAGMMQTASVMKSRLQDIEMPANIRAADEIGVPMDDIRAFMEKRSILRMVDAINDSGKQAAEIVDNMLSFARKTDAIVSSKNIEQLVDKILELATTDYDLKQQYDFKTIKIVKEYEDNLPMVPCEGAKIQLVLLNILRNGAQAMQAGKASKDFKPCFILRLFIEESNNMLRIEIEDNGPGMDKKTQKRVFEPFFTTKPVGLGTGLGLSVSYFIVTENHGGTMDVKSAPGKGSKFIIRLPLEAVGGKDEAIS
jgi:PAS domain S-box-containing protein